MAVQDVRVKVSADTDDLEKAQGLIREIGNDVDATEKEVKRVNKQYKEQVGIIEKLEQEMQDLEQARKQAQDPKEIKKYNKALKNTEGQLTKLKGGGGFGGLTSAVKGFGAALAAGISIQALFAFGKEVGAAAIELENLSIKASTVFGNALPLVEKWAQQSAAAMGLTETAAIGAATAMGDLLVPMGFTREQAAKMSTEVVGLAGALSEWTGGQRSAEEVAQILAKAMLGEREQLKELGIAISEADVQGRLLEKGQSKLTGTMLQQAKAVATQELIFEKSRDAQSKFANSSNTLARNMAKLSTIGKNLIQDLAANLLPTLQGLAKTAIDVAKYFGLLDEEQEKVSKSSMEVVRTTTEEINKGNDLINRYDELSRKTNKTAGEKIELNTVARTLVETFGDSVTQINNETGALEINSAEVRKQIGLRIAMRSEAAQDLVQQRALLQQNAELLSQRTTIIENARKALQDLNGETGSTLVTTQQLEQIIDRIESGTTTLDTAIKDVVLGVGNTGASLKEQNDALFETRTVLTALGTDFLQLGQISNTGDQTARSIKAIDDQLAAMGISLKDLQGFGKGAGGNGNPLTTGIGATKEANKDIGLVAGSVAELQAILTKLSNAQKNVATDSVAFNVLKKRIEEASFALQSALAELPDVEAMGAFGEFKPDEAIARGMQARLPQIKEMFNKWAKEVADEIPEGMRKAQVLDFWEEQLTEGLNFAGDLFNTLEQVQEAKFARGFSRLEEMRQKELQLAGADAAAREQIEMEYDKRADQLRREQFQKEKDAAKQRAIIEGVLLVLKSVVSGGGIPAGLVAGALAAAQVVAQIAIIDSATFAKGGFTGKGTFKDQTGERVAGVVHEDEFVFQKSITRKHLPEFKRIWKGESPYEVFAPATFTRNSVFNDGRIVGAIGSQSGIYRREMKRQNKLIREQNRLLQKSNPTFTHKRRLWS